MVITATLLAACASEGSKRIPDSGPDRPTPPPPPPPPVQDASHALEDGLAAAEQGDQVKARELWRQAETFGQDPVRAALLVAGSHLQDDGDLAGAEAALERALARAPHHAEAVFLLGRIREAQGRWGEAQEQYRHATELAPAQVQSFERLAAVALHRATAAKAAGDPHLAQPLLEEALQAVDKARQISGERPTYLQTEARAREALGDFPGAEAALKRWSNLDPGAPGPHRLLAEFYERHGDPKRAAAERAQAGADTPSGKRKLRPLRPSR